MRSRLVTCPTSLLIPVSSALYCHYVYRKVLLVAFPWGICDLEVLLKIPGWVVQCAVCYCSGDSVKPKEIRPWATVQISAVSGTAGVLLLCGSISEEKSPVIKQQGELYIVTFKPLLLEACCSAARFSFPLCESGCFCFSEWWQLLSLLSFFFFFFSFFNLFF